MPDAIFDHPRLAAVYDAFDGDRSDLDAYLAIVAEAGAATVLDVGCGTGSLAVRLAASGRTVTAVDPAVASLEVARAKDPGGRVRWVAGEVSAVAGLGADLAVMTGNVAQVFLSDDEWAATVQAVGDALRPGGWFVFETRRPEFRAWEEWACDTAPIVREVPGVGVVTRSFEVTSVDLPNVSFRYRYRFADGAELTSDSTLRFRSRAEIEASLAGWTIREVRQAPDRPGREFVVLASR